MARTSSIQIADRIRLLVVIVIAAAGASPLLAANGRAGGGFDVPGTATSQRHQPAVRTWTLDGVVTHRPILSRTSSPAGQTGAAAVAAPWAEQDIGSPALAGSSIESGGLFTISGSGADIWGTADQFHFVYQPLMGDGEIIARVDSVAPTSVWAKAGVMVRETLNAGSTHAFALVSSARGIAFQRRLVTGGSSYNTFGTAAATPQWVRLVRIGNTFSAYQSTDGAIWRFIGSQTIAMSATVYAGLAVTSHSTAALTTASLSNVVMNAGPVNQLPSLQLTSPAQSATFTAPATIALTANASDADGTIASVDFYANRTKIGSSTSAPYSFSWANVPAGSYVLSAVATDNVGAAVTSSVAISVTEPVGALPAPWTSQAIGSPALAGTAGATTTGLSVQGAGTDIWYSADQFEFISQPLAGDGDVTARVDSLTYTSAWAKAGVMIRESTAAGSTHAFALVSAGKGVAFQRRTVTGGASTNTTGTASAVPRWVRITRQGSTFTAYESADGTTWRLIGSDTIAMANTVLAGLAVTSHNANALTTAAFSSVTVTPTSTPNQPPSVTLTNPANGATFTAPGTIALAANANDADGTVTKVDFYQGTTLIGTATTSPYAVTWNNVAPGTYSLTAVATDNAGATTTSAVAVVRVDAPNQPPSVAITSPTSGFSFGAPAVLTLTASASDPDGSVAMVQFYAGTTLLGTATAAPFSLAWNVLAPGAYTITAIATDNAGATTTSASVSVVANPSRAVFTASVDHDTLVTSYRLDIFAAGADPRTAQPVATRDLGKPAPVNGDVTIDITTLLQPLAPGTYSATVSAVGAGGSSQSTAVTFVR